MENEIGTISPFRTTKQCVHIELNTHSFQFNYRNLTAEQPSGQNLLLHLYYLLTQNPKTF